MRGHLYLPPHVIRRMRRRADRRSAVSRHHSTRTGGRRTARSAPLASRPLYVPANDAERATRVEPKVFMGARIQAERIVFLVIAHGVVTLLPELPKRSPALYLPAVQLCCPTISSTARPLEDPPPARGCPIDVSKPTDIRASAVMDGLPSELHTRKGYRDAADGDMGEIRPVVWVSAS